MKWFWNEPEPELDNILKMLLQISQIHSYLDAFIKHQLLTLLLRADVGHLLGHVPAVLHHLGVAVEVRNSLEDNSAVHARHSLAFLIRHPLSNTHRDFGAGLGSK